LVTSVVNDLVVRGEQAVNHTRHCDLAADLVAAGPFPPHDATRPPWSGEDYEYLPLISNAVPLIL
jgi:hypothetical protein